MIFLSFVIILNSCGKLSEGMTGSKRSKSSDEFLIQKKNPLVMPPGFEDLPPPKPQQTIQTENDNAVENLFKIYKEKEIVIVDTLKNRKKYTKMGYIIPLPKHLQKLIKDLEKKDDNNIENSGL